MWQEHPLTANAAVQTGFYKAKVVLPMEKSLA
jgi:hypothetical protein